MKRISKVIAASALLSVVSACTVVAPRPVYHDRYTQDYSYVQVAPPAPQIEVIGVPPYAGHVWLGGAWYWEGGRHTWHPGHWEAPRHGHAWVPHRWEHDGHYWHFREGRWDKHH